MRIPHGCLYKKCHLCKPWPAQSIIDYVNQILAAKQSDPQADTTALELEVDRLVYGLYGLTEEEVALIEG